MVGSRVILINFGELGSNCESFGRFGCVSSGVCLLTSSIMIINKSRTNIQGGFVLPQWLWIVKSAWGWHVLLALIALVKALAAHWQLFVWTYRRCFVLQIKHFAGLTRFENTRLPDWLVLLGNYLSYGGLYYRLLFCLLKAALWGIKTRSSQ